MSERADGVYFGLPEAHYRADSALGSTDIKNLIVGPEVYWANTPMNPLFAPKETAATARGQAYHKLILEGEAAFSAAYCLAPEADDYKDVLYTAEEIKARLEKHGARLTGKKSELVERLLAIEPAANVWDEIRARFATDNPGKAAIGRKTYDEIRYAARFILANPYLRDAFSGGFPEVSIFATIDGIRRKARIDYLKPAVAVDLKSYSNSYGARADVAIHQSCARHGHDLQAAWYRPLLAKAKQLPAYGDGPPAEWMKAFRNGPEHQYYFVYQETGGVPMARAKWMSYELQTFQIAALQCQNAVELYKQCVAEFGADPWIVPEKPDMFDDAGFPMFRR